jgi:hypothetical protein
MKNNCVKCTHWIKDCISPRYYEKYGPGLCIFDNCCTEIPHHIRHNSNGECKLFNKQPEELWPDIIIIKEK